MHLLHYLKNKWGTRIFRGHLLNDHLGGLSVEENLFPISSQANSNHLQKIERYVKGFAYRGSREVTHPKIIYRVEVFNADQTQRFSEFEPVTKFRCDVEVYVGNGNTPEIDARYDVYSDISNNTSNKDAAGPFGDDMPYANNTGWRTGKNNLEPRSSNGNDYELKRQGTDVSMGTVHAGAAPYIKSVKDTKFKTRFGWGHMVKIIYPFFRQAVPDEMIEFVNQQIIESGDGGKIQDTLDHCDAWACCQNIARDLEIIREGQTISQELYLQVCSRLIYDLWQDTLTNEQERIKQKAEDDYLKNRTYIDQILLRNGHADAAELALCSSLEILQPVSPRDKRYLSHMIHMSERHILEDLHKEILLIYKISENLHNTAFPILTEKFGEENGVYSMADINFFISKAVADSTGAFSSFPMLYTIHTIYGASMMNAYYLCTAIDSIAEEISSEIKNNVIRHLEKCDEEQRWGDAEIANGLTFHQAILEQIMSNNDSVLTYQNFIGSHIDEVLFRAAYPEAEIKDNSLRYEAVQTFLKNKIAAQEKWFADILFQICYGYLKPGLEQILIERLSRFGDDAFRDLTIVYPVLMEIVKENLVGNSNADFVVLKRELSEDDRLAYYINTTMADYDWLSSPEITQDQIAAEYNDEQNIQMEMLFRNYFLQSRPLKNSLFEEIVYRMAYRWIYERLSLNDDDDGDYVSSEDAN